MELLIPSTSPIKLGRGSPHSDGRTLQIGGALVDHSWQRKPAANLVLPSFQFRFFMASMKGQYLVKGVFLQNFLRSLKSELSCLIVLSVVVCFSLALL